MDDLPNVYDLFNPSPIPLEQLACKEVALILWRREILQNITESGALRERNPRKKTSLRCLFPELPTTILRKIEEYVIDLMICIPCWLDYHSSQGILKLNVLKHFQDFVFDFNGRLDYSRTAKRFVACKGISDDVKFKMACRYCLEDDILRIWPRVSSRVMANEIDFDYKPLFDYWVCRLTNQPHEMIEEELLWHSYYCDEWLCAKYFFSRFSSATRMRHIENYLRQNLFYGFSDIFYRYMLVKLNQEELKVLVNKYGAELFIHSPYLYNLRIWDYIKNNITDDGFLRIIKNNLKGETMDYCSIDYCAFWANTPNRIKQAAIRDVLLVVDSSHFDRRILDTCNDFRSVSFLLAALSDTPIEDRKRFWKAHWKTLYVDIRPSDFRFLINLCFNNDQNQIISFKEEFMYSGWIRSELIKLLKNGYLEEVKEFLMFWCPNKRSIKEFCQMLLYDNFIFSSIFTGTASSLNEFIENAFEDTVLANDFKNRFFVLPDHMRTIKYLKTCIRRYEFRRVMEFVDTFALSNEIKFQMKQREILPNLMLSLVMPKKYYIFVFFQNKFDEFENFMNWMFESDDDITRFKEMLDVDELIRRLKQIKKRDPIQYLFSELSHWFRECFETLNTPDDDSGVKKFLKWYFVTPEAVEMFEKKYSHDSVFNRLLIR